MQALRTDRTSFVIAHRLSTIRDADVILVMENGRIVEQGNHEDLLAREGAYYRLYMSQFRGPSADIDAVVPVGAPATASSEYDDAAAVPAKTSAPSRAELGEDTITYREKQPTED
jgi:ATP-binding cassette subfamily B protein